MQLSEKRKSFSQFLASFLKTRLSFEHFEIKDHPHSFCISEMRTLKTWLDKCRKRLVSEDPSRSNMVNVPKHCWNVHYSTLMIFIVHCLGNWVGKSLSYWHAKSRDWLLTHWLPMKSILFLIGTISRLPIYMQLSQKQKNFSEFFAAFLKCSFNFKHFEKKNDFVFLKLGTRKT